MANTGAEAREMVAACDAAGVKLMIAYRCQYERYNREAIRLVRSGALGRVSLIEATNTQVQGSPEQWRMRAGLAGGGALPDIGLYCLNGAQAMLGEEPVEVFPLELHGTDAAGGSVASLRVVEPFDIVEHVGTGLVAGPMNLVGRALGSQRGEASRRGHCQAT